MTVEPVKYQFSVTELQRRKTAFTTLLISLFIGIVLISIDLTWKIPGIICSVYTGILILSVFFRSRFFRFADTMQNGLVILDQDSVTQQIGKTIVSLQIDRIRRVWVKRTVAGTIREIQFMASTGKKIHINGVKEFERFLKDVSGRIPHDAVVGGFTEKIDYDHRLFYVFFGLGTGGAAIFFMRCLTILGSGVLQMIRTGILTYITGVGIYWLAARPFSRQGICHPLRDFIFGSILILAGIIIFLAG